jgi:hypothetical protein
MYNNDQHNLLRLCDEGVHISQIYSGAEKEVLKNINSLLIEIKEICHWMSNLKIKNIGEYELLEANIKAKLSLSYDITK